MPDWLIDVGSVLSMILMVAGTVAALVSIRNIRNDVDAALDGMDADVRAIHVRLDRAGAPGAQHAALPAVYRRTPDDAPTDPGIPTITSAAATTDRAVAELKEVLRSAATPDDAPTVVQRMEPTVPNWNPQVPPRPRPTPRTGSTAASSGRHRAQED